MSKGSFKLLLCRHSVAKTELKIELANVVLNRCNLVVATSTVLNLTIEMEVTTDRYNYYVIMTIDLSVI
jgi:hypothetical protein